MLLYEKLSPYRTIAIVGMAKNSGKTTVLNHLMDQAFFRGERLGITSIGRDGESRDIVTNTSKPRIFLYRGTLVASARQMMEAAGGCFEILEVTDHGTYFGNVVIGRALRDCMIQIAGPRTNIGIKEVAEKMINLGAHKILVDGALERVSSASPSATQACILASGASLSRDMGVVTRKTATRASILQLEQVDEDILGMISPGRACVIDKDMNLVEMDIKSVVNSGSQLLGYMCDNVRYMYLPGAVTYRTLKEISESGYDQLTVIIGDGTRLFVEPEEYVHLQRRGLRLKVLNQVNLVALTMNPVSPKGYYFESEKMQHALEKACGNLDVYNILE